MPSLPVASLPAAFDVALLGEAMLMLVADRPGSLEEVESFRKSTAGAETNVAVGLSRLGFSVGWASRLGDDSMGRYLLAEMRREGIDCSHVALVRGERTGFQFKGRVDDGSDPPVEYHRAGSAASHMGEGDLDAAWLKGARHLHVTGVFPAVSPSCHQATRRAIALAREAGRSVSFDPNLRPTLWPSEAAMRDALNALAAQCDTVLPGIGEGLLLTGHDDAESIAAFYRERGAARVIVKLGPDGAYYDCRDAGRGRVPAFAVREVIDTVGAGDGFAVGVVSALLEGKSTAVAARRGAWIGARAVQVIGDTEGLPSRAELMGAGL